jgi:hypothetical protein
LERGRPQGDQANHNHRQPMNGGHNESSSPNRAAGASGSPHGPD